MTRYVSPPLDVPVLDEGETVDRADLVFYGVDHSGPSYLARVFVDAPDAGPETPTDDEHGYVGAFTVFGHDGCYGDAGHCLPGDRHADEFDQRPPHPLTPWTKTVIAGRPLLDRLEDRGVMQVTVTVVALAAAAGDGGALQIAGVRLLAYQD